jgi:hypothetical protein
LILDFRAEKREFAPVSEIVVGIIGIGIGWVLTHLYYKRSSKDIHAQFDSLNARFDTLQKALTNAEQEGGTLKLDRDAKGEITGAHVIKVDTGQLGLVGQPAVLTITKRDPDAGSSPVIK